MQIILDQLAEGREEDLFLSKRYVSSGDRNVYSLREEDLLFAFPEESCALQESRQDRAVFLRVILLCYKNKRH